MKTAYELAMERLNKTAPLPKLTAAQKKQIAELDTKYAAKIAEREIALQADLAKAEASGIQLIDKEPRPGAHGADIAFLHPKSTLGVLLELCKEKH